MSKIDPETICARCGVEYRNHQFIANRRRCDTGANRDYQWRSGLPSFKHSKEAPCSPSSSSPP